MNAALKSASQRYEKLINEKSFLINPISEIDCEIIIELYQILSKAGLIEVKEILKNFKILKDVEIRDDLLQWNIDHPTLGITKLVNKIADKAADEEDEEKYKPPVFFKIGDTLIHQYDLHNIIKYERFDEKREEYFYGLIINPMPEGFNVKSVPPFANYKIEYSDESNRNEVLKKLAEFLLEREIKTINLDQDEEE